MDTELPPHVNDFLTEYFKNPQAITVDANTDPIGPKLRVRISADYQASQKGLVPDVTVEVEGPYGRPSDLVSAREQSVREFQIAFNDVKNIIAEGDCKPEANHKDKREENG